MIKNIFLHEWNFFFHVNNSMKKSVVGLEKSVTAVF